jgi:hypothetical protein
VVAKEALVDCVANEAVPNREPVIPAVTSNDPVMFADPDMSSFAFGVVVPIPTLPA